MKLKNLFLALAAVPFFFASCTGETETFDLKVDNAEVIIEVGSTATVKITDGNSGYTATPNNKETATAEIKKGTTEITISGVAVGTTEVKLEDSKDKFTTIKVIVVEFDETATKVTVEDGKSYAYKHEGTIGSFKITSVKAGEVSLTIGGKTIKLSDAGTSYLTTSYEAVNNAAATQAPGSILMCLLANSSDVASATLATNAAIKDGAKATLFTEIK
ncbi:hypothetical protein D0T49_07525 [Paludibacter sp. 221]|uniref:hypothetical protein n=1 Tax=Paludibacter sp. 221 TaxID=2302939 RepID=UPI0013D71319|nr:hypothetical protein [Paludibacter sp. 221]NDV46895.1 hypothetical protein [Paludibacter sp. 221]